MGVDFGFHRSPGADAGGDLVGGDHAFEKLAAGGPDLFGHGQGRRDDVDGGVPTAQAVALVHLQGDAGGAIHEGGQHGPGGAGMPDDGGLAGSAHADGQFGQLAVLGQPAARQHGAKGVEDDCARRLGCVGSQIVEAELADELGEFVQVFRVVRHCPSLSAYALSGMFGRHSIGDCPAASAPA